jgi:hypothetical protein
MLDFDTLSVIAGFLDLGSILNFRLVCKLFKEIATSVIQQKRVLHVEGQESRYKRPYKTYYQFDGVIHGLLKLIHHGEICTGTAIYGVGKLIKSQGIVMTKMCYDRDITLYSTKNSKTYDGVNYNKSIGCLYDRSPPQNVRYWIKSYSNFMELKIILDNKQKWVWKYPRISENSVDQYYMLVMPPFKNAGITPGITLDNCSLTITYRGRLLFEYRNRVEMHYRNGAVVAKYSHQEFHYRNPFEGMAMLRYS